VGELDGVGVLISRSPLIPEHSCACATWPWWRCCSWCRSRWGTPVIRSSKDAFSSMTAIAKPSL